MEDLQKYLGKYQQLTPPEKSKKKLLISVIQDECGILLTEKAISLTRGGVIVSCHPTIRSELTQCVPRILSLLQHKHNLRLNFIR